MEILKIEGTEDTPAIILDKKNGKFEISGRSLPEDSAGFYEPVLDWINTYKREANASTDFVFRLEYSNTASSKFIREILVLLNDLKGTKITWYSQEDDEDMQEAGNELAEQMEIPFEFKIY